MKQHAFSLHLLAWLGCFLAFMACSDDKSVPQFVIDNETFRVSGQGEEAVLTYQTLSWPRGAELSVSSDQEWLHDFDTSTPGEVRFTVDAAPYSETKGRQATLTITSPNVATLHTTVEVRQAYNSSFAYFQLDQVEDDRVGFHLFMNTEVYNNVSRVIHYCFTREEADAIQTGEQLLDAIDMKMEALVGGTNYTLSWRVTNMSIQSLTDMFCDLKPDTEYCLMALGMQNSYEPVTSIQRTYFTTEPAREHPVAPATLTAKIVNGIGHIELQTECENPYIIVAAPSRVNYQKNPLMYDGYIRNFASTATYRGFLIHPENEARKMAGLSYVYYGKGPHYFFNISADLEMVFVVQAYDERLRPLTDLMTFEVDTYGIQPDCCTTSIEMLELEPWYANFRAQSSDPSMILRYGVYPTAMVDSMINLNKLALLAYRDGSRLNGPHEFGFHSLLGLLLNKSVVPEPGKEYTAFAYSSTWSLQTSPLTRMDFKLPAEQPSSVKADVQEVKYFSIEELVKRYDLPMLEGSSQKYLVTLKFRTPDDVEHIDDYMISDSLFNSYLEQYQVSNSRALLIALARQLRTYDDLYRYWMNTDGEQFLYFIPYEKGTHQIGEITKIAVTLTPEGCAPVEEFKEHYSQFELKEKAVALRSLSQIRMTFENQDK